ncbi:MAG: metallophosphoesterase [Candidatus Woykebacteria bacterium RBG_16_43_9]|uniref:Metallophosphoesterase n=2 Tax=Candidatus Woykeibacteriota TaxID=1817899 RepID=A0A1G1WH92_9BACT|nr:MAG: metallophosphoesterase [Candidatus Woykebacteria bacterium RBG_16_43_9]OGY28192.1 MAG: metallophosphoesterase [Candidatus Woykebacteria bacterium RBG_19FT_COMBO_43_10]
MKILFIGDIVAKPGRAAVKQVLPDLVKEQKIDLVVANIENLAHGKGATERTVEEIREAGVDIMTSGNHIWFREGFVDILNSDPRVIRPANYPADAPGYGFTYANVGSKKVLVTNLIGRQWIDEPIDEPYHIIDALLLDQVEKEKPDAILVDYHAEATSEKAAMAWFLDGRVTAVVGTHTHVPSADAQILPRGTAFVTDIGMTGAAHSVLGVEPSIIIKKQKDPQPIKFEWVETGPKTFRSVLIETKKNGTAKSIQRIDKTLP